MTNLADQLPGKTRELAARWKQQADAIRELVRVFREAKAAALPSSDRPDPYPSGRAALEPAISLALRYAHDQGLLPRQLAMDEVWEGFPLGRI